MAVEEDDEGTVDVANEVERLRRSSKLGSAACSAARWTNNAYLDIQAGSGGTRPRTGPTAARMYLRWADKHGFDATIISELSEGEVAGIKEGATVRIKGEYAFGWLRTEIGVHRLVRRVVRLRQPSPHLVHRGVRIAGNR